MFLQRYFKFMSHDMAIDLGTANTVVYVRGRGIVLNEPSVVAIETINGVKRVRAVGDDAKLMMGKTPGSIEAIRPLRDGVIADIDVAEQMIKHFIQKVHGPRRFPRWPEIVICVPSGSTSVERRAIRDAASNAGASQVWLIEEPMAAAIGADMPVTEPIGSMVVDIGGGTTEVAVLALGGIVVWESVKVGGYELDEAVVRHVDANARLLIGSETAEAAKIACGAAWPLAETLETQVAGRDRMTGMLRRNTIDSNDLRAAIAQPIETIVDTVKRTLESTPPELAADLGSRGSVLAGGGALLRGLDQLLGSKTGLPVVVAEKPLECVVLGAGSSLEESELLGRTSKKRQPFGRRRRRR